MIDFYLEVESAYISKNIPFLDEALSEHYLFTSVVYVEGKLLTSRTQSKAELLIGMFDMSDVKNESGLSLRQNVEIIKNEGEGFCGRSKVESPISMKGDGYKELEEREICFVKYNDSYKAVAHRLEFVYRTAE